MAAHPDDEVIGAGAHLGCWKRVRFVHITDGAPRKPADALRAGYGRREEYARARRQELLSALALAGFGPAHTECLGIVDQEASVALVWLANRLRDLFRELQPELILTHPYEGGHPDHDATAFAVDAARQLLEREKATVPSIIEMSSYHNRAGQLVSGEFLTFPACDAVKCLLTVPQRLFKRRLFECFPSQREVLRYFPLECETFRIPPVYDFTQPPHPGKLYYELFDWGMNGSRWRQLAHEAIQSLDLNCQHRRGRTVVCG